MDNILPTLYTAYFGNEDNTPLSYDSLIQLIKEAPPPPTYFYWVNITDQEARKMNEAFIKRIEKVSNGAGDMVQCGDLRE